jgi:hypothetical protein
MVHHGQPRTRRSGADLQSPQSRSPPRQPDLDAPRQGERATRHRRHSAEQAPGVTDIVVSFPLTFPCRSTLGWPTEGFVGQEFHDEVTGADGTIAIFTRRRPAGHAVRTHQPGQGRESAGRAAQLDRVQPGYPRPVAGGGRQAARTGRSRWRHADSTRAYAPVWRLLRVLHRSRWSSLRNRLELQRVGLVGGSLVHASAARSAAAWIGATGPRSAWLTFPGWSRRPRV